MTYYTIQPSALLSRFVRFFWVLESNSPNYTHRSMADVCSEFVFHYNGQFNEINEDKTETASFTAFQGPSNRVRRFRINKCFGIFGVYLFPYSIPVLFGIPATELLNQMPDLATLFGKPGEELEYKIMVAASNEERVAIVTTFLEERIKKNYQDPNAAMSSIQTIIKSKGQVKIEMVAREHFLSERQFERKFKEYSGLSPKLFSRIVRFHSACSHFADNTKSLTEIAYESGYYDQSHFIHDFKEFSGVQPKHYFAGMADGTEWMST